MALTYKTKCTCKHEFQDKEHGPGIRVCTPINKTAIGNKPPTQMRCTVCSAVHGVK